MNAASFPLLNLVLAFHDAGTIWAHEVDIFRSWTLLVPDIFRRVQAVHWHKLPCWLFLPVALACWFDPNISSYRLACSTPLLTLRFARTQVVPKWVNRICATWSAPSFRTNNFN